MLFQGLARFSGNRVYVLTINGMRKIYSRVGGYYFMDKTACKLALRFYIELLNITRKGLHQTVMDCVKQYGRECDVIWFENRDKIVELMKKEEA